MKEAGSRNLGERRGKGFEIVKAMSDGLIEGKSSKEQHPVKLTEMQAAESSSNLPSDKPVRSDNDRRRLGRERVSIC